MRKITPEELKGILDKHSKWLKDEKGGERADLSYCDLDGASLDGANLDRASLDGASLVGASLDGASLDRASLVGANLDRASLDGANLDGARLVGASLVGARLVGASLDRARLVGASLVGASLDGASLVGARLVGASLVGASLVGASLDGARLVGASLDRATGISPIVDAMTRIVPEGSIIGWKKAHANTDSGYAIVKLRIPEKARRSNATGRKCRAEWAEVVEVIGAKEAWSDHEPKTIYRKGKTVRPDKWDENRWDECSNGIHFFITEAEAREYSL